jgi:iron(III) transport system substrate-binding protein
VLRPFPRSALAAALVLGALALLWSRARPRDALVVYCAHDSRFSEKILRDFEKRSGVPIAIRFDTEATKSLGLVELLIREKDAPRCDVFWNNELLGTLDLQERGVMEPYRGAGFARIPAAFKDPDGHWTGFAARLRVLIGPGPMTDNGPAVRLSRGDLALPDASRMAVAKPLYGTTLTHYTALWRAWGSGRLQAWHRDWRRRGVRELNGNAAVKDAVATGACDFGFTDTDDFFEAKDEGKPVAMLPVRLDDGATICIPNTVAIIRGTGHPDAARQLVDFLLSEETELALAHSASRQIPLGPVPVEQVPAEVRELMIWAKDGANLTKLGVARAECLAWLKAEYLR